MSDDMSKRLSLSDQIRRAVDECGLSRYEVCKRLGLDQAHLSRFMAGTEGMSIPLLDRLADFLGVRVVIEKKAGQRKGRR